MLGLHRGVRRLPAPWALPITQAGMAAVMIVLLGPVQTGGDWVSVAFYVWGLILGILLISQFWTLANGIYDPRQAKRLFGFIGGGAMLGGMTGALATAASSRTVGTNKPAARGARVTSVCARRHRLDHPRPRDVRPRRRRQAVKRRKGVGLREARASLLRESKHLQIIALVISFASIGAAIIEQQLNMAAEAFKGAGPGRLDRRVPRPGRLLHVGAGVRHPGLADAAIHRYLGIGFALLMPADEPRRHRGDHPLERGALGARGRARPRSSLPLHRRQDDARDLFPAAAGDCAGSAKPFVDVTVDRLSRGARRADAARAHQAVGLGSTWQQLSYVSLA